MLNHLKHEHSHSQPVVGELSLDAFIHVVVHDHPTSRFPPEFIAEDEFSYEEVSFYSKSQ